MQNERVMESVLVVHFQIRDTIIHGGIYTGTGVIMVLPISLSFMFTGSLCSRKRLFVNLFVSILLSRSFFLIVLTCF